MLTNSAFCKVKLWIWGIKRFSVAKVNFTSRCHLTANLPDTGSRASTLGMQLLRFHFFATFSLFSQCHFETSSLHYSSHVERLFNVWTWEAWQAQHEVQVISFISEAGQSQNTDSHSAQNLFLRIEMTHIRDISVQILKMKSTPLCIIVYQMEKMTPSSSVFRS